jgi:hypothetical protein
VDLYARDRAGRRSLSSPPRPALSLLWRTLRLIEKTLAGKLDVRPKTMGKLFAKDSRPLARYAMLASHPGRTGPFAGQELRFYAQDESIQAHATLLASISPLRNPVDYPSQSDPELGIALVFFPFGGVNRVEFFRWIFEVSISRKIAGLIIRRLLSE